MASIKISDLIQPFAGEGDIVQWLDRLTLVSKRLKDSLADVMPLFLEGPAYAVYCEMPEDLKQDDVAIAATLKEAFGINAFLAYEQFASRKWRAGEPVDVYLAALRRLAKLADVESEALLRRAFIVGLPSDVSRELRAMTNVGLTALPAIVDRARALMAETSLSESVAASAEAVVRARRGHAVGGRSANKNRGESRRCFRCGGPHFVRDCTVLPPTESPRCQLCDVLGHVARDCQRLQGNASGRAAAPAALPTKQ